MCARCWFVWAPLRCLRGAAAALPQIRAPRPGHLQGVFLRRWREVKFDHPNQCCDRSCVAQAMRSHWGEADITEMRGRERYDSTQMRGGERSGARLRLSFLTRLFTLLWCKGDASESSESGGAIAGGGPSESEIVEMLDDSDGKSADTYHPSPEPVTIRIIKRKQRKPVHKPRPAATIPSSPSKRRPQPRPARRQGMSVDNSSDAHKSNDKSDAQPELRPAGRPGRKRDLDLLPTGKPHNEERRKRRRVEQRVVRRDATGGDDHIGEDTTEDKERARPSRFSGAPWWGNGTFIRDLRKEGGAPQRIQSHVQSVAPGGGASLARTHAREDPQDQLPSLRNPAKRRPLRSIRREEEPRAPPYPLFTHLVAQPKMQQRPLAASKARRLPLRRQR